MGAETEEWLPRPLGPPSGLKNEPIRNFPVPDDVMMIKINPETGHAASFDDPTATFEVFVKDNPPEKAKTEANLMAQGNF